MPSMTLCQIALSTIDLPRSQHWYRNTLGFVCSGTRRRVANQFKVPGLPEGTFDVEWVVGRGTFAQFEMFEFERPRMRAMPADRLPSDIGYTMLGMHVDDFDAALARIAATTGAPSDPVGAPGHRRVSLRDPDGVWLELMEDDVRPEPAGARFPGVPIGLRTVTISVPDLARARLFWSDVLGYAVLDRQLHTPAHEAMWGLVNAERRSLVVDTGPVLLELVEYTSPRGRARPAGQLISDQGILNVALGSLDKADFDDTYARLNAAGYRTHAEPWRLPEFGTVAYVTNDQGFSVEIMHVESLDKMCFKPL